MSGQLGGQPIYVLPEGTMRDTGRNAQKMNIAAAKAVAEAVRTTLGPKGMDKMLTDSLGDVIITNDGVTILDEMEIKHPAAKMMVEVAKAQDDEVGDGTTSAVIISGELLKKAEGLIDQNIHPTTIAQGYRLAKEKALKHIESVAEKVTIKDTDVLQKIAMTAMTGKSSEAAKDFLAKIAVEAVTQVAEEHDSRIVVDLDHIKLEKKEGGSTDDTELVRGVIIDKERVHSGMPTRNKNAKIALLNTPIEVKETETDAKIQITDPNQLQAFLDQEEKMIRDLVDKIVDSGASAVFCQKGVDDMAQHLLAKKNLFVVRRVKKSDMEKLARASGGRIVNTVDDLSKEDLGHAGMVEEKKIGNEAMTFVTDCEDPKSVSILVRGGTEHVVDEIERAMDDAIGGVSAALEVGRVVAGGGAPEADIAKELRSYAETVGGREQLAINAFADAIEIVPRTLAENAGLDPIDVLVELRTAHDKAGKWMGLDVFKGNAQDMWKDGVIEPLKIKTQAIKSASEAAEMILRIDDVILASKLSDGGGPMPDMGGMGGMPPGMM